MKGGCAVPTDKVAGAYANFCMKYSIIDNKTIDFFGITLYATVLEEDTSFLINGKEILLSKGTRGPYVSKEISLEGHFWGNEKSRIVSVDDINGEKILSFVDNKVKNKIGLNSVVAPGVPSYIPLCKGNVYIEDTWLINSRIDTGEGKVSHLKNSIICESNISSSFLSRDSVISFSNIENKDYIKKDSKETTLLAIEKSCIGNTEFYFSSKHKYGVCFSSAHMYNAHIYSELPINVSHSSIIETELMAPDDFSVKEYIFENVFINYSEIKDSKIVTSGGMLNIDTSKLKECKIASNVSFTGVIADNYCYSTTPTGVFVNISEETLTMSEIELSSNNNIYVYSYNIKEADGIKTYHALSLPEELVFNDTDPYLKDVNCSKDLVNYAFLIATLTAETNDDKITNNVSYIFNKFDHIRKDFDDFINNNINSITNIFGKTNAPKEEIARSICFDLVSAVSDKSTMKKMLSRDTINIKTKAIIRDCFICSLSTIKLMYPEKEEKQDTLFEIYKTDSFIIV